MKTIYFDKIDSTNDYCKQNDSGEDLLVVAKKQTAGRGTKGRSFTSDEGGLYLSLLKHYKNFPAHNAFKILINACVAVCKTLEQCGVKPVIRWSNDILANGKKISGTLIENTFSNGHICRSIVGIGLNINNEFNGDLRQIATSLKEVSNKNFSVNKVLEILKNNLNNEYSIKEYKSYMPWLNGLVLLKTEQGEAQATALDIADDGRLICKIGEEIRVISSAEVSLRFQYELCFIK
ncbi:MAG: biotin--[acetyl-CoA-carboxylase] ligase [Clostridiales bacterium]|nr:biotin--[acetyl-CoA-carboxylase] ligase [Clostridiales bacterium]